MKESIMAKACIINEYGAEGILADARKGAGGKQERALIIGGSVSTSFETRNLKGVRGIQNKISLISWIFVILF